ncbi:hypothetical protein [Nonomuraea sediminis]|uniref:hypothetical protein n=1 Tax=Nonomuraea sediminis TaxID=2835864 RepID=UPI001BDD000A|nr:hypothetical protein [Nonomuraea sediminis]
MADFYGDEVVTDAVGRAAAGTDFQMLADETARFTRNLRVELSSGNPLPYEEVGGYHDHIGNLLDEYDELVGQLGDTGSGQRLMASTNVAAEDAIRQAVRQISA